MPRIAAISEGTRLILSATLHAEVAAPGSPAQRQAARLQAERFARIRAAHGRAQVRMADDTGEARDEEARDESEEGGESYERITDYAPRRTLPIVVWRARHGEHAPELVGTARLELPGATLIEGMI